jgi:hypothetical protein
VLVDVFVADTGVLVAVFVAGTGVLVFVAVEVLAVSAPTVIVAAELSHVYRCENPLLITPILSM